MEFFRIINIKTTEEGIQKQIAISNLEAWSTLLFNLDAPGISESKIGGIWGEFTLVKNEIKGGIRFALVECPNALCWTVTTGYPPDPNALIIHMTINRKEKDKEFIEEIHEVLDDLEQGIKQLFSN